MNIKIGMSLVILFSLFVSFSGYSQIRDKPIDSKFSVSLLNGGYWNAYNYGLKNLNYNIAIQGEYKINKYFSAVINTGFDFQHFKEDLVSLRSNLNVSPSAKLVMFEFTTGMNCYFPVQRNSKILLSANLGYYNERIYFPILDDLSYQQFKYVDDNWSGRFGINGGFGFESGVYRNVNWVFQAKYNCIFTDERDMKFVNINLGLKYSF
jgi:hypothetical protein